MSPSVRDDDTAPPRASRGLVWRGLLAGVVISLVTAGAVSASVLLPARTEGEDRAILATRDIDFPFAFPTVRTRTASYEGKAARTYRIRDEDGTLHDAYRLVLHHGFGEYYGVQGTTWRDPPILADAHETVVRGGRRLSVYRDGRRVRLVAWSTPEAVYWVSNTLTRSLTEAQMLGIAASLRRL